MINCIDLIKLWPADDAFNQLREHLQRGDTCPDVIIKSLLTEVDRPQTTPGEMQKQRAILAEHLLKAGWDADPPFLQREHTGMSLFSLLTRFDVFIISCDGLPPVSLGDVVLYLRGVKLFLNYFSD